MQDFQPLRRDLHVQARHTGEIRSRAFQRLDQSNGQWVRTHFEHDWYCRAHRFCRKRCGCASGRNNHGHRTTDQICRQCRQFVVLTFSPPKFDRDIASLDVSTFAKTLAEGSDTACERSGRLGTEISNHGHRPLRARRKRPRRHRDSKIFEEFPPRHGETPGQEEFVGSVVLPTDAWKGRLVSELGYLRRFGSTRSASALPPIATTR